MRRTRFAAFACVSALLFAAGLLPHKAQTVPVLVALDGGAPNAPSRSPMLAPNGRVVALATQATNVVSNDTDAVRDILVVNLAKVRATCVSVSSEGVKADGDSDDPVLDRARRHVVFASEATNLVAADTNAVQDVFVHDLRSGETVRLSEATDGTQADGTSRLPWISANGRVVAFSSEAANLVADDTNGVADIFLRDLRTGVTTRASLGHDGSQGDGDSLLPRLSANGRYLAFVSEATGLVPVDGNGLRDAFVRDLKTGAIEMVSVATDGTVSNGHSDTLSISANGRRVAFDSRGSNLHASDGQQGLDVFVRDRLKRTTTLVSRDVNGLAANGPSTQPALSGNGRWLAFTSGATSVVAGDTNGSSDVFRVRLKTGEIERVSISSEGAQADRNSDSPVLSRNGRYVAFSTRATNLFAGGATDGTGSIALRRP